MNYVFLTILFLLSCTKISRNSSVDRSEKWMAYKLVQEAGFSDTVKFRDTLNYFDQLGSPSLLVAHKGKIVFCRGDCERRFLIHSMRKYNGAVWKVRKSGDIDLGKILEFSGIDDKKGLSDSEKKQRY